MNIDTEEPKEGVGEHCIPKDTKMPLQLSKLAKGKIMIVGIDVNA